MKRRLGEKERSIKQINISLDQIDQLINDDVLTRSELTKIILHRHILAMKDVLKYAEKNLGCSITYNC